MERGVPSYNLEDYLRAKIELKNLDYKLGLDWNNCSSDERLGVVKDILAMSKPQDGGTIIFGVRNQDFSKIGVTDVEFASFDQTKVNDLLHEYTDPKFTCFVYKHDNVEGKKYVSISVPEFPEIPIICKKDANSSKNQKAILARGQLYIRPDKATSVIIPGAQEMRELLGRAIRRKSDDLLSSIEQLMKGKPPKIADDSREQYEREIKEADGFAQNNLGKDLTHFGSWEITTYPIKYVPKRIPDLQTVKDLLRQSQVQLRNWTFPHPSNERSSNFSQGRQSIRMSDLHPEAYRRGSFLEDKAQVTENGRKVLFVNDTICFITEVITFCKRCYELIAPDESIHLKFVMNGTKDRLLVMRGDTVGLSADYISKENPIVLDEDMQVVELKASAPEIARNVTKQIFDLFNWDYGSDATIYSWQTRLLERRL